MKAIFDESLVTGNELIDTQHQEWFGKINNLLECCEKSSEKLEAVKMLNFMADYTEFHFSAEEALQEEVSYPGIEDHKKQHGEFKKAVEELHDMLVEEEGPSPAFVEAVNKNVVDWLYKHIKEFDASVASYISSKN